MVFFISSCTMLYSIIYKYKYHLEKNRFDIILRFWHIHFYYPKGNHYLMNFVWNIIVYGNFGLYHCGDKILQMAFTILNENMEIYTLHTYKYFIIRNIYSAWRAIAVYRKNMFIMFLCSIQFTWNKEQKKKIKLQK